MPTSKIVPDLRNPRSARVIVVDGKVETVIVACDGFDIYFAGDPIVDENGRITTVFYDGWSVAADSPFDWSKEA